MRFILNFFFFGILFYLIWMFFPDAFKTLVSWADQVVAFFKGLIQTASDKVHNTDTSTPPPAQAWLIMLPCFWLVKSAKKFF